MESKARLEEVVNTCLDVFIEKGIETGTRELSKALNLQNAGIFYYFKTKKELVIACSRLAVSRMEKRIVEIMLNPYLSFDEILVGMDKLADEIYPTMQFLVSVILSKEYKDAFEGSLSKLELKYSEYTKVIASNFKCSEERIKPVTYMLVLAFNNYMIFRERALFEPQLKLIKEAFERIIKETSAK